ncbi:hypothetical protein FKP32DRAFT_1590031 [Trametes sanguinea]|nr:hypothetical protein FKP32DRAFT_1590031 [Trametes sanguinea]
MILDEPDRHCGSPTLLPGQDDTDASMGSEMPRRFRIRNPQFARLRGRSAPYESSDDTDCTISSGVGSTRKHSGEKDASVSSHAERPSLLREVTWAFVAGRHGDSVIGTVQQWQHSQHHGIAFPLWHAVRDPTSPWNSLTRLRLELDSMRPSDKHQHGMYRPEPDSNLYPNWKGTLEIVELCRMLGGRLTGLSITMCSPELRIPHIPPFIYGILHVCPELLHLGIEDTQCEGISVPLSYLAAAVLKDGREDQWELPSRSHLKLQTFIISKRSITPWQEEYRALGLEEAFRERLRRPSVTPPEMVEYADGVEDREAKSLEASALGYSMCREFPELRKAYVTLDRGAVQLRLDWEIEYPPLSASEVYLGIPPVQ